MTEWDAKKVRDTSLSLPLYCVCVCVCLCLCLCLCLRLFTQFLSRPLSTHSQLHLPLLQVRDSFIKFFESKQHTFVPSSGSVPVRTHTLARAHSRTLARTNTHTHYSHLAPRSTAEVVRLRESLCLWPVCA